MEFDLIEQIRARAGVRDDVILGIGDDAAILQVPAGQQLVVCVDTLNAGVHFPLDTAPADIGWKALAVNLSDLAAMGATPAWCTLSLSLPQSDAAWLDRFLDGFLELAVRHGVALVGGDTTRGPLSVGVTVHGFVAPGRALRRDAAVAGDDLWVTGTLGDAAGALELWRAPAAQAVVLACEAGPILPAVDATGASGAADAAGHLPTLRARLDRPTPRVAVGLRLAGLAHAAIDLSDGLLADLGHVCAASGVGARIALDALPASPALVAAFDAGRRQALQAAGGDDYELCFSAPVASRVRIEALAAETAVPFTRIGNIVAEPGVRAFDAAGRLWQPSRPGYEHFAG